MNDMALFAGAGGSILAGKLLGWRTICAVELDAYCRSVLLARQRDGFLPRFPIWDDIRSFDGKPWHGHVDIISGGFPCQDISDAGKRTGISGARSGLWTEFARIIGEVRPSYAFIENTAALAHRGLDRVLADLAALGMDVRWCCLGADDVGAPHIRKRLWILATDPNQLSGRLESGRGQWERGATPVAGVAPYGTPQSLADTQCAQRGPDDVACRAGGAQLLPQWQEGAIRVRAGSEDVADAKSHLWGTSRHDLPPSPDWGSASNAECTGLDIRESISGDTCKKQSSFERAGWWHSEPDVGRVAHGVAARMDRLRALGNGWVPHCAVAAWHILFSAHSDHSNHIAEQGDVS